MEFDIVLQRLEIANASDLIDGVQPNLFQERSCHELTFTRRLQQIMAGQDDPTVLAQLARGRLRDKIAELERALTGHVRASHRTLKMT